MIHGLDDILQLWCYAEDLESFEHANRDLLEFTTGKVCVQEALKC